MSRTGVQHNHVVSLSNGNDKGSYYISFGYTDNKGVIESLNKKNTQDVLMRINRLNRLKVGTNTTLHVPRTRWLMME